MGAWLRAVRPANWERTCLTNAPIGSGFRQPAVLQRETTAPWRKLRRRFRYFGRASYPETYPVGRALDSLAHPRMRRNVNPMTGDELKRELQRAGLSHIQAAAVEFNVHPSMLREWIAGNKPVPDEIAEKAKAIRDLPRRRPEP